MVNFIETYQSVLSNSLCNNIINSFDSSQYLVDGVSGSGLDKTKKNSIDLYLNNYPEYHKYLDIIYPQTIKYLTQYIRSYPHIISGIFDLKYKDFNSNKITNISSNDIKGMDDDELTIYISKLFQIAPIQVQKYNKNEGGFFNWHSEVYPLKDSNKNLDRILFFIYYLNDVSIGGETDFYHQNIKISPIKGNMIISPGYFTHTHRGNKPISNDKYILTSWILFNDSKHIFS